MKVIFDRVYVARMREAFCFSILEETIDIAIKNMIIILINTKMLFIVKMLIVFGLEENRVDASVYALFFHLH